MINQIGHEPVTPDKVIFRVWKGKSGGDVIALFPQIPADDRGIMCQSYQHVGQHGAADLGVVSSRTRPATPEEYASLLAELKQIGYHPEVAKRATAKDRAIRRSEA